MFTKVSNYQKGQRLIELLEYLESVNPKGVQEWRKENYKETLEAKWTNEGIFWLVGALLFPIWPLYLHFRTSDFAWTRKIGVVKDKSFRSFILYIKRIMR